MKKFFKSLALVLALTLVFGSVNTFAATAPKLATKTSKVLYLDGAKGSVTAEDGTVTASPKRASFVVKVSNAKSSDITVASADEKIAKVAEGKTRTIVPVAMGTTTLTVSVKGKEVGTIKVTVKKNADEVKIDVPEKVYAGEAFTVTLPRKGVDTDERALACDSKDVTIEDANGYGTKYTVTAAKAGKITLKACAFQSATYTDATATASVEVNVGSKAVSIKQTSKTALELTCVGDAAGITKNNVSVYTMLGDVKVNVAFKDVTVKDDKATINFFAALTEDATYYVEAAGETLDCKIAKLSKQDAAEIVITTTKASTKTPTAVEYQILTVDGIDITSLFSDSEVSITTDNNGIAYMSGKNIVIYKGDNETATVKAEVTISYWDADNKYQTKKINGVGTIVSVGEAANVFVSTQWTVSGSKDDIKDQFKATNYVQKVTVPMSNYDSYIIAQINFTKDGKAQDPKPVNDSFNAGDKTGYKFVSADTQTLIVDPVTGKLTPVKKGSAQVVIMSGDEKYTYGVCEVAVGDAVAITDIEVTADKYFVNTKTSSTDQATLTIKTVDNYGTKTTLDSYSDIDFTVKAVNGKKSGVDLLVTDIVAADGTNVIKAATGVVGTAVVNVKYTGVAGKTFDKDLYITFDSKTDNKGYSIKTNAVNGKIDTKIAGDGDTTKTLTISVAGIDGNYTVTPSVASWNTLAYFEATPGAVSTTSLAVQVVFGGKDVTKDVIGDAVDSQTINVVKVVASQAKKLATGEYTVILYKFDAANITAKSVLASTTFVVEDTQPAFTVELVDNTKTDENAFVCKYDGKSDLTAGSVKFHVAQVNNGLKVIDYIEYTVVSDYKIKVEGPWVITAATAGDDTFTN